MSLMGGIKNNLKIMNGIGIITENKTKVLIGNKTADEVLKEICEICHHNLIYLSSFRDKLDKIEDFDYEEATLGACEILNLLED